VDAEYVVVVSEEDVEQEQLSDSVDEVEQFDDDVAAREVVAVQSSRHEDAVTGHQLTYTRHAARAPVTTSHQIAVQQVNSVPTHTMQVTNSACCY